MTSPPRLSLRRVVLLAGALLACAAPSAHAAHWPGFGGDAGRSGNQPVDAGGLPLTPAWKAGDGAITTSVVTSGGPLQSQRVIYGTSDGVAGERAVCTDMTAPYTCDYRLGADDVGRTTIVAVATDTAGQTAAALRTVRVSRFTPASVRARTAPRRDRRRPYRLTTSGRVRLHSGLTRARACGGGDVAVVVKAGRTTISTRRVALGRACRYRSRVTFRSRSPFTRSGRLRVRVRFLGNAVLGPRRAKAVTVRTRRAP